MMVMTRTATNAKVLRLRFTLKLPFVNKLQSIDIVREVDLLQRWRSGRPRGMGTRTVVTRERHISWMCYPPSVWNGVNPLTITSTGERTRDARLRTHTGQQICTYRDAIDRAIDGCS